MKGLHRQFFPMKPISSLEDQVVPQKIVDEINEKAERDKAAWSTWCNDSANRMRLAECYSLQFTSLRTFSIRRPSRG